MMNKEFPQTELQEKIRDFWSVRGWSVVKAVLGNLNVSFHKEHPKYDELGLSYQYLEQFWEEARKEGYNQALKEYDPLCRADERLKVSEQVESILRTHIKSIMPGMERRRLATIADEIQILGKQ